MFVGLVKFFGSNVSWVGSTTALLAAAWVVDVVLAFAWVVGALELLVDLPSLPQAEANVISRAATPTTCVRRTCVSLLSGSSEEAARQFPSCESSGCAAR